jgi:hypothetical protein
MSLHITGRCLGITEETRGAPGNEFTARTLHVLDGVHTYQCNIAREFRGVTPEADEIVALDVAVSAWKSKAGNVGTQFTALGRNLELETLLGIERVGTLS